jgi:hypothetical protein
MGIGMEIPVLALASAHELKASVGNNLVGVHVCGGPSTSLDRIDHELVQMFSRKNFITGTDNSLQRFFVQKPEFMIGLCRCLFDKGEGSDEHGVVGNGDAGNAEILKGPVGLRTIQDIVRDIDGADAVVFVACHGMGPEGKGERDVFLSRQGRTVGRGKDTIRNAGTIALSGSLKGAQRDYVCDQPWPVMARL